MPPHPLAPWWHLGRAVSSHALLSSSQSSVSSVVGKRPDLRGDFLLPPVCSGAFKGDPMLEDRLVLEQEQHGQNRKGHNLDLWET